MVEIEEDIKENETNNGDEVLPEKCRPRKQNNQSSTNELDHVGEDENNIKEQIAVDGEIVLTSTVERGMDTMFLTVECNEDDAESSFGVKDQKELIQNQKTKWFNVCFYD